MAKPLVSVCITTYNHENYIAQAIESILAQDTNFDVEIIIGEDCSQDNTAMICLEYASKYPGRISLILSDKKVGMRENYRRTIRAARGKYIAFCDGDDFWVTDEKLQWQIDLLEAEPEIGMCYTHSLRYSEKEKREWMYPQGAMVTAFEGLLFNNTVENCTTVARKQLIEQYYDEIRPEEHPEWLTDDAPMWLWFAAKSKIIAMDEITASHTLREESVSQSKDYKKRIAFCDSLVDISLFFDERYNEGRKKKPLLCKRMEVALWVLSYNGGWGEYFSRWWQDVKRTPSLIFNLAGYGLAVKKIFR